MKTIYILISLNLSMLVKLHADDVENLIETNSEKSNLITLTVKRSTYEYQVTGILNENSLITVIWEKKYYPVNEKSINENAIIDSKRVITVFNKDNSKSWLHGSKVDQKDLKDAKNDVFKFIEIVRNKQKESKTKKQ